MGRGPHGQPDTFPFTVDWVNLAFLAAVVCIAVLWWRAYGPEFIYQHFRFCTGCRRDAINCSCPPAVTFTPWEDMDDDERDDAL